MSDIQVKRYYWSEASTTATTTAVSIDAVVVANSFARPLVGGMSYGAIGNNEDNNNFFAIPVVTGPTTVTVNLSSTTRDVAIEGWIEVWEYVGPTNGPNEFKVLHHGKVTFSGASQASTLATSGSTLTDMVAIWGGNTADSMPVNEEFKADRLRTRLEVTSLTQVTLSRYDGADDIAVGVTVIELTGANWTVTKETLTHPASTPGAHTHTITSVTDWANTMYFWSHEQGNGGAGADDSTMLVYPGSGLATQVKTYHAVNVATSPFGTLYCVHNDNLLVEHNDTRDGDAVTPAASNYPQTNITATGDFELTTAVGFYCGNSFNGTDNTALGWIAWLADATTFATSYKTTTNAFRADYSFQIIDMANLVGGPAMPVLVHHYRQLAGIG